MAAPITILDGAVGTRLGELGVDLRGPAWSATDVERHADLLLQVHREYARAGADVLTANTFRTTPRRMPGTWREALALCVRRAREAAAETGARVAGSVAPVEDCYRPDLAPDDAREDHCLMAEALCAQGVDILLCETFPHVGEAMAACDACVGTGVETWVSFTAGPDADLMTPEEMGRGARLAVEHGASAVLVNCVPATRTLEFVRALTGAGVAIGAYANAGSTSDGIGWSAGEPGAALYADLARAWIGEGATIVGSCCGTGPEHTSALSRLVRSAGS